MIQLDLKITQIEGFNEKHLWMMIKIVDIMKRYRKTKFKIDTLMKWTNWGRSKVIETGKELRMMGLITIENTTKQYGGQGANQYKITTGFISYLENMKGELFDLSDEMTVSENQPPLENSQPDQPLDVVGNGVRKSTTAVSENQPPIKPINYPIFLSGNPHQNFDKFSPTQNPNPSTEEITLDISPKELIGKKFDELMDALGIDNSEPKAFSIFTQIKNQIPHDQLLAYLSYLIEVETKKDGFHSRKTKNGELVKFVEVAYSKWFWNSFLSWRLEQESAERARAYNPQIPPKFTGYEETKVEMTDEERAAQLEEIRKNNPKIYKKIMQLRSGEVVNEAKSVAVALPKVPTLGFQFDRSKVPHGTKVEYIDVEARKNQLISQLQGNES
jgi:hypothetical protein